MNSQWYHPAIKFNISTGLPRSPHTQFNPFSNPTYKSSSTSQLLPPIDTTQHPTHAQFNESILPPMPLAPSPQPQSAVQYPSSTHRFLTNNFNKNTLLPILSTASIPNHRQNMSPHSHSSSQSVNLYPLLPHQFCNATIELHSPIPSSSKQPTLSVNPSPTQR